MFIYLFIWFFSSLLLLFSTKQDKNIRKFLLFVLFLFIGLRFEVGGDWFAYTNKFDLIARLNLKEALIETDFAYGLLNRLSYKLGLGIIFVNSVCAFCLLYGLYKFCEDQKQPQLGILVAIPFLLFVVGIGYTRQAAAIGFIFLAIQSISRNKIKLFFTYIIIAALFHGSAIVMLPVLFFYVKFTKKDIFKLLPVFILFSFFIVMSFSSFYTDRVDTYTAGKFESEGALPRILFNLVAAIIFIIYRKRFKISLPNYYPTFQFFAIATIFSLLIVSYFTTIADRLAIYFSIIQVSVYSNIAPFFTTKSRPIVKISILIVYSTFLIVWLLLSDHANKAWIPYKNFIFQ